MPSLRLRRTAATRPSFLFMAGLKNFPDQIPIHVIQNPIHPRRFVQPFVD